MKIKKLLIPLLFLVPFAVNAQTAGSYWKLINNNLLPVVQNYTMEVSSTTGTSTIDGNLWVKKNLRVDGNFFAPVQIQVTGFTQGSALFVGPNSTIAQNNANFFWDNTNARLGIGTSSPYAKLSINALPASYTSTIFSVASSTDTFATSTLFTVLANGNVGIGTTNPLTKLHVSDGNSVSTNILNNLGTPNTLATAQAASLNYALAVSSNTATQRGTFLGIKTRGTLASPTAVQNGDSLFAFISAGYDGANNQTSSGVFFIADGAVSSGVVPTAVSIHTGTNSGNRTERLTVSSGGNVGIGTTTPQALLSFPDNTVAAGGIKFGSDVNLYRGAANQLTTDANQFSGSNVNLQVGAGLSNFPSHAFSIDPDTGMYRVGANTLGFSTGGLNAMVISSAQLVGIGTSTPTQILSVQGNGLFSGDIKMANLTATGTASISGTATVGSLDSPSAGFVRGAQLIVSNGAVSPLTRVRMTSGADGVLKLQNSASNGFTRVQLGGTTSGFPALGVYGANLNIESSDASQNTNLGVGTTTVNQKLVVQGDAYFATSTPSATTGIILVASDGTCHRLVVSTLDVITSSTITCP